MGLKSKAAPVFFLSLVGVDIRGKVDDHESIFDIYSKIFEFLTCDVTFKSAQDLKAYYDSQNNVSDSDEQKVDIYTLVEYFVKNHPDAHYVLDEVPFLNSGDYSKCIIIPVKVIKHLIHYFY